MTYNFCLCADCDSTSQMNEHGHCITCGSNSTLKLGNKNEAHLRFMRNTRIERERNLLLFMLPKTEKGFSKVR